MDDWEPEIDPPYRPKKNGAVIAVLTVVAIGAGAAAYWVFHSPAPPPPPAPTEAVTPEASADAGLLEADSGLTMPAAAVDGDTLLRSLAGRASKSADLARWLSADGILQRIAAAVRLIAIGQSPRPVLSFIELKGDFVAPDVTPTSPTSRALIAPESYARYDEIAQIFASVDAAYCGRAYAQLRPYFDAVFSQVAKPGERFDDVLVEAIGRLVTVPLPGEPVEVVAKGGIYLFKDPALESRSPAEKHLLRMGAKNAAVIQNALRRFAESARLRLPG